MTTTPRHRKNAMVTDMVECDPPVLLSLPLIADVLGKPLQSVQRWNTAGVKGARLPAPDRQVGATPLWFESTVLEYAGRRGLVVDWVRLDRIRAEQAGVTVPEAVEYRVELTCHTFRAPTYEHRRKENGWPEIECQVCGEWREGHRISLVKATTLHGAVEFRGWGV